MTRGAKHGGDKCTEMRLAGQVVTPTRDVDAGQHDFGRAVHQVHFDFAQDLRDAQRATGATALGDDAEGAGMIAPVLHGDEGAGVLRGDGDGLSGHVPGPRVQLGGVGHQPVDFGHRGELPALDFGRATGDEQAGAGPLAARAADCLASLAHRLGGDGAGIDDHRVVIVSQKRADAFALGDIEPAAERDHFGVFWGGGLNGCVHA